MIITDKEIQEAIKETYKATKEKFKVSNVADERFLNLKAHIKTQDTIKDILNAVNIVLVEFGTAVIKMECAEKEDSINVIVDPQLKSRLEKHFDFSTLDLFYSAIDFFTQAYESEKFETTTVFLNKEMTSVEIHIGL